MHRTNVFITLHCTFKQAHLHPSADGSRRSSVEGLLQGQFAARALDGSGSYTARDGTCYEGEVSLAPVAPLQHVMGYSA